MSDSTAPRFEGTADSGAASRTPPHKAQLSETDLKTMTAEQIVKAQDEGRLDQLLGRDH